MEPLPFYLFNGLRRPGLCRLDPVKGLSRHRYSASKAPISGAWPLK